MVRSPSWLMSFCLGHGTCPSCKEVVRRGFNRVQCRRSSCCRDGCFAVSPRSETTRPNNSCKGGSRMYKLVLLAGISGALMGTPAFAVTTDLSTLYIIQVGGAGGGGGDITTTPGTLSASGKTASGFPTPSGPKVSVSGSGTQTGSSADDSALAASSWDVQIEGPSETDMFVPILITGSYSALASGTGTAFAGIGTGGEFGLRATLGFAVGGEFTCSPTLVPSGCGSGTFALSASIDDSPLNDHTFSIFTRATGNLDG